MARDVVELARELIDIPSVTGNEKAMADFLETYLSEAGWRVSRQEVAPGRDNIWAYREGKRPRLIFNSHIDTVPPFFPCSQDETHLYGRGACDTKSLIAAQLLAAEALVAAGIEDFGLLYVVGEEVDHSGMIKANELALAPEFLIVGEPTESKLVRRQKGLLKVKISCKGKAAHSGYPHTGISAIDPLIDVLYDIRRAPWPNDEVLGDTTLNVGILAGGRAANVVPDFAHAEVMIRVVTDYREIEEQLLAVVAGRADVTLITGNNPVDLATLDGYSTAVVAFNTDIPYFKFKGKAFLWGAGSILDAHTAGEKIAIADLRAAVAIYEQLARTCLGQ